MPGSRAASRFLCIRTMPIASTTSSRAACSSAPIRSAPATVSSCRPTRPTATRPARRVWRFWSSGARRISTSTSSPSPCPPGRRSQMRFPRGVRIGPAKSRPAQSSPERGGFPMSLKRFENKVAVITGAASGIGAATARLFAREGAHVVLADIGDEGGRTLARDLGPTALAVRCDVSKQKDVEALIQTAVDTHGRIDILFNNAGIGSYGSTVETTTEQWLNVIAVDLHSVFYACHAAIPHMPRGSAIVNTASISGLGGDHRFDAYNAAKGDVVNYTRSMAVDHARDGIRVNALCPGLVDTPITAGAHQIPGLKEDRS